MIIDNQTKKPFISQTPARTGKLIHGNTNRPVGASGDKQADIIGSEIASSD
jgi:hypothetical protein